MEHCIIFAPELAHAHLLANFPFLLFVNPFAYPFLRVESDGKELSAEVAKLLEARCEARKYHARRADADIGTTF